MSRRSTTTDRHPGGRHRTPRRFGTGAAIAVGGTAILGAATAVTVSVLTNGSANAVPPVTRAVSRQSAAPTSAASTSAPAPATSTPAPATSTTSPALVALRKLVASRSGSSTSVAALDTVTGKAVSAGATSGMTTASAVKVQLLESLLLERQRSHEELSSGELASATAMIEHSDNGAAEDVFWDIGGHDAVVDLENDLGLSTKKTVMGDDDYWGLTTTSASQQLVLLRNLVDADSPLDAQSRKLALGLMRNVEADQTWGVPVTATSGDPAVKNGWLNIDSDDGLWAVNSLGVVTIDGHTVLIAVMTQHNDTYSDGVTRVQRVARAAATAVRS